MSQNNLDQKLQAEQPTLSATEQADLWQRISPQVSAPVAVISPYTNYLSFIHSRTMTSLIIALIFILGAGGTVAVSEAAKPGDILFPIERVAEKTRLAFAGDERAAELRADYATQRWEELLEIIEEEGTVTAYDNATSTASSTGASVRERVLVDNTGEERISKAVNVLLDLLADVDNENTRNGLLTALLTQIDNVSVKGRDDNNGRGNDDKTKLETEDSRIKINDDRIEVRENGYRIKINQDGEVKVKQNDDNDDDDSRDDDSDDDRTYQTASSSVVTPARIKLEVEADVYTDITEVKVELSGVKSNFVTLAKTKEAIAQEVATLYLVDKSLVLQVLDLEVEDGSSIKADPQYNDDDNSKEDDEDRYEDEDEEYEDRDEDRRGEKEDDEDKDEDREEDEDDEEDERENN